VSWNSRKRTWMTPAEWERENGMTLSEPATPPPTTAPPTTAAESLRAELQRLVSDREAHERRMAELDDLMGKWQEPTTDGANAVKAFGERVDKKVDGGMTYSQALRAVSREQPDMYTAYRNASFIDGSIPLSSDEEHTTKLASAYMGTIIGRRSIVDQPDNANYTRLDPGNLHSGSRNDPIEAFLNLVNALAKQTGMDTNSAMEEVSLRHPDMYKAYRNATFLEGRVQ
jgi:hypothetical protein